MLAARLKGRPTGTEALDRAIQNASIAMMPDSVFVSFVRKE